MKDASAQSSSVRYARWGAVGMALIALMLVLGHREVSPMAALTAVYMSAGACFLVGIWALRGTVATRLLLFWIVLAGLMMRALCLTTPPQYETDYYRYLWDGAVTAHGHSPYAVSPQAVLSGDPSLAPLARQGRPILERINHPGVTTIYPPVAQAAFALAYLIHPFDATALRVVFLAADLAILLMLFRLLRLIGRPLHFIAIYWWNPMVVKEFYVGAHMDGLAAALALAAVLATAWQWRRVGLVLLALAIGTKIWPIVLAPVLLRHSSRTWRQFIADALCLILMTTLILLPLIISWQVDRGSGVRSYSYYWINNAGFFSAIQAIAGSFSAAVSTAWMNPALVARLISIAVLACWLAIIVRRPIQTPLELIQRSLMAVGGLFLLSPTQFPWYYTWTLPFLALVPWPPLLLYTALLPLYHIHYDHPWVLWVEHLPVWAMMGWMVLWRRGRADMEPRAAHSQSKFPAEGARIAVVIPALNEEKAIAQVLRAIPPWVDEVVVADNGSTDRTAEIARSLGARVVDAPRRGYGAACQAGIAALNQPDIVVFLDADFSDHPEEMDRLVQPILADQADLVIGSRVLGQAEPRSLSPQQRLGNALACFLIRMVFRTRYTDLGPFRAIRHSMLERLQMTDMDYGWTVQMQVRAARCAFRISEQPVRYRRRIGRSKISGTIRGVIGAGTKIIWTILREAVKPCPMSGNSTERLIIFARYPEAGKAKTRLIPLLGAEGASRLHRQLVTITLETAGQLRNRRNVAVEVRCTGASIGVMEEMFGRGVSYRDQGDGGLGERLSRAVTEAASEGAGRVVMIGTDCPSLASGDLDETFDALESHDLVLGPAEDGGYYLIGMKRCHADLFRDIPWGGPQVLDRTLQAAARLGLTVHMLALRSDIDTPEDLTTWARSMLAPAEIPWLSIIIPARNEQDHLAATLAAALSSGVEIIVVDALSTDRTAEIAKHFGATVISAPPSRGAQLNAGAAHARADTLLFLHADTLLPPGFDLVVNRILRHPNTSAGAFTLGIDGRGFMIRLVEWGVHLRSSLFGRPYGDQAIFMTRKTFDACGGFPNLPYMEDYAMLRRLGANGRIRVAPERVRTAARSWQRHGVVRTTLCHQWIILRYTLGLGPPERVQSRQLPEPPPANAPAATIPVRTGDALQAD